MVEFGAVHGIRPGDFFGPVSAAHCLKEALQSAVRNKEIPEMLRIYVSQDAISKSVRAAASHPICVQSIGRTSMISAPSH